MTTEKNLLQTNEKAMFSDYEIRQFRNETTGTKYKVHFNNAGASLPPDVVVNSVVNYLQEEAVTGGYEMEAKWKDRIESTYGLIAKLINAAPAEIAITENASTAWNIAFNGIGLKDGDEIITSEMEYITNLLSLLKVKQNGVKVTMIGNDENGNFKLSELERAITYSTKLIAVTHISSSSGMVLPVGEIGKIARRHGILYLVDACQSVGHLSVDVKRIHCDLLTATGRKYLRAPRGTGFLFVRSVLQNQIKPAFIDQQAIRSVTPANFELRSDARRYELYEKNRALTIGLNTAVEYALQIGMDKIEQRITFLAAHLRKQLSAIKSVTVHDAGKQQCGIVTFSVSGIDSGLVKAELAAMNINISIGTAAATLIYMKKHGLDNILRASVHYYNTEEEIQLLCGALQGIISNP